MKLQVSARQRSVPRIRDSGPRDGDVEGIVPDSRLAVIARLVHREAVSVDVVHARAAGKRDAGAAGQTERIDGLAVHVQALGVIGVLELAVEPPGTARARVEPEGGDIAAGPQLAATGHERVARLGGRDEVHVAVGRGNEDRKSTRLNSSHTVISYAVFCLKKKNKQEVTQLQECEGGEPEEIRAMFHRFLSNV